MTTINYYSLNPGNVINEGVKEGSALIDKMLNATVNLSNYSADYSMTVYKDKNILKESGIFYFRKPKLLRIEVKQGSRKGSLAVLTNDGKIHGHLGGMMKYFSGVVLPNSDLAKALNGFPMAGTDFYSLAAFLHNMIEHNDLSLATIETVRTKEVDSPCFVLDIYSSSEGIKPLLLKRVFIDPKTYLPLFWQDYINGKLWSESTWQNVHINLNLPDKIFQA